MAFTTPYIKQRKSYFYILKGQENGFNPKDIRNKKIGKILPEAESINKK